MTTEQARAIEALQAIPADLPRDDWVRAGMAAQAAGLDFDTFDAWSAQADSYDARAARDTWRSFQPGKGVGAGTLYRMAAAHGWRMSSKPAAKPVQTRQKPAEQPRKPAPNATPLAVWNRAKPATAEHGYIRAKGASGAPLESLRVLPADDTLRIAGQQMGGALVVPAFDADGGLQSLQLIPPPGAGKKLNLPGCPMAGASFTVGEVKPGAPVYLAEGIGAAWACWVATGNAAVVCFGWSNVGKVAAQLRQKDEAARLVLVPDTGKEEAAAEIARELGCMVAAMPEGWPSNSDVNDLAERDGHDVLADLLEKAQAPEPPPLPLSVAFADELPATFTPPDELVEGLLTVGDGSILYGDSNSGKTFFAIDLACAVARGTEWMGRNTEPGLVVYLAAESPGSVRSRLQAYQRYHQTTVPNFAIVQSPVDLFSGEADADAVIAVVRELERQRGQKARLIVGDTLARLSAGANENAGSDMGLVVRRFDRIRTACNAHFLLIHHSGKVAANGARGWSGIRAAIDTEIEVTDSPQGRCAEITKQRDLNSKGQRIGFKLEPVTLGRTKWGADATSCVVLPADAPDKPKGKRMGEVEGAVVEFLAARKTGIKKAEVVKHFEGRYEKGPVYRAMQSLVKAGAIHEAAGMVCIAEVAK